MRNIVTLITAIALLCEVCFGLGNSIWVLPASNLLLILWLPNLKTIKTKLL